MGKRRFWFHWYQVQLSLAALLQILLIGAPLSFASNWDTRISGYLHPAWVTVEEYSAGLGTDEVTVTWAWQSIWLALLTLSMLGLAGFMLYVGFVRRNDRGKIVLINISILAFLLQIVGAYFIARTVYFYVPGSEADIEFVLQHEFFIQVFPPIILFFARQRIKRRMRRDEAWEEKQHAEKEEK